MPGCCCTRLGPGRSEPRATRAGQALPPAPVPSSEPFGPQQGLILHLFGFTQDTVGDSGGPIPSLNNVQAYGAMVWAPPPPPFTPPCLTAPVLLPHRVPYLGLVVAGGEGMLHERSPHLVTTDAFTLTNGAFPRVGMVLEAQLWSSPEHSPRGVLTLHTSVCTLAPLRESRQLPDSALRAAAPLTPALPPALRQGPVRDVPSWETTSVFP